MLPETIWNAGENEGLRENRPHFNALAPGDALIIPDPTECVFEGGVDQRHKFKRKGQTEDITLVMKDEDGEPRKDLEWQVTLPGGFDPIEGQTGDDGKIEFTLPAMVKQGMLRVGAPDRVEAPDFEEEHVLRFGGVDPITTPRGLQHRLENLGYAVKTNGKLDAATKDAIMAFQSDADLPLTGELCASTQAALEERYGS